MLHKFDNFNNRRERDEEGGRAIAITKMLVEKSCLYGNLTNWGF
jgi:hypothetical protein